MSVFSFVCIFAFLMNGMVDVVMLLSLLLLWCFHFRGLFEKRVLDFATSAYSLFLVSVVLVSYLYFVSCGMACFEWRSVFSFFGHD